eukprot:CAMPEP_0194500024 /NCGR_PEP_ID=MMETSP0253-20130528/16134_1 /TAXON_ID=2966 /ORGANISM="Noctiluca scintillans" /LENGTH=379 /DNA_ID=CAMNT_0039341835 /DNA_START=71 /DNA_END=1210 /DNA_ORIENTATION=+
MFRGQVGFYATPEERALLKSRNYLIRPLATAGNLNIWQVVELALWPIVIFIFTLSCGIGFIRFSSPALVSVIYYIGLVMMFLVPVLSVATLLVGILATRMRSHVRSSAIVFWLWWPTWKFVMCLVAAVAGTLIGNYAWYHNFLPNLELKQMQTYTDIDPLTNSGLRLQDAGVIGFSKNAGVDRTQGDCFRNRQVYCIAPIIQGTDLATSPATESGNNDLFMAGTGCCGCPDAEFRCGDWNSPAAMGGLRVVDQDDREMYRLAAQDWAATYGRTLEHPIFFEWTANPAETIVELRSHGVNMCALALCTCIFGMVLLGFLLNGLFRMICDAEWASPIDPPLPTSSAGQFMSKNLLPDLYKHKKAEQDQREQWLNPAEMGRH